jgi:hypothetical protein
LTGSNTCEFPISCLADVCKEMVSLPDLSAYLPRQALSTLLRLAVDNHVRRHHGELHFCLVPTCPGIYQVVEGGPSSLCSTCGTSICHACSSGHDGITCEEYQSSSMPPDRLRMTVVDDILTLRCPRCKTAFLDFEGCFALSCGTCPCKFCGWCLHDCGSQDAHPHVKKCPHKEPGADQYFGSKDMFQCAQNKRRKAKLVAYLGELSLEDRRKTLESLGQDLKDLGIVIS